MKSLRQLFRPSIDTTTEARTNRRSPADTDRRHQPDARIHSHQAANFGFDMWRVN